MNIAILQRLLFGSALLILAFVSGAAPKAYVISQYKWGTTTVSYYVNPQNKWVSQNAAVSAFQTAAAVWHEQTRANIQLAYAGYTSGSSVGLNYKNEVFF